MSLSVTEDQQRLVRQAARALGRNGLAHAYGHCSLRLDDDHMLVCAAMPMGLIPPGRAGTVVPVRGPLPEGVLGEVRLHQQIYQRRPEIRGVCRSMPAQLMSLSALGRVPRPRHGMGSYFYPQPALWPDVQLIRDDERAVQAVDLLEDSPALVMKGNGVVTFADSLEKAVVLTWFLEDAARIELDALRAGLADEALLSAEDARARAIWGGGIAARMWAYLTQGDPEA
ncbi:class II aldolase/adducin family protein [Alkalilimnicola sp. S0819]|uniref:class II aldolase/adducin family protein n=1 Tax=Alkalilimnicola sp. S0819 TaxID=2613922 RepID=UPI00126232C5|nr:class II aldolase/adducin family protein [Alkalilimnicola sp. S0819]KAB7619517.1 class II aldolase/adducin family protein [Alkalilimnicola sp. S0819]MPQ17665.1 class II aldolase/adducin family protein [Alkalilimnicola sp. S0819]